MAGACRDTAAAAPATGRAVALVTFIGHATFLIQTAAGNILTDPMYSQRAESVGMHFGTFQMTTEGIDEPMRLP